MTVSTQVAISYDLKKLDSGVYVPVTDATHLAIQAALRAADTNKLVDQVNDPEEQCDEIHTHVLAVPLPDDVEGHSVDVDDPAYSKASPTGGWVPPDFGGSVVYAVYPTSQSPASADIWLVVATIDE